MSYMLICKGIESCILSSYVLDQCFKKLRSYESHERINKKLETKTIFPHRKIVYILYGKIEQECIITDK